MAYARAFRFRQVPWFISLVLAAVMGVGTLPCLASSAGGGVFDGTMTLNPYPCNTQCIATFSGSFDGVVQGVTIGSHVYAAAFPDPTTGGVPALFAADLSSTDILYSDTCLPGNENGPAIVQSAAGSFAVSGGALIDADNQVVYHGIKIISTWGWTRVTGGFAITVTQWTVQGSTGTVLATSLSPLGAGSGVVTPPLGFSTCSSTSSMTVTLTGSIVQPA